MSRRPARAAPRARAGRRGGGVGAAGLCGGGGQGDALLLQVPLLPGGPAPPTAAPPRPAARRRRPGPGRRGARDGEPRAVARLISLVEDASPGAARGHGAAGAARRARPGRRADRLAGRRQVDLDQRAGVGLPAARACGSACSRSTRRSPFSGGALLGDRVRMQDHATDDGVFIRSMASRGHLGGLSWATPQALRVLTAAGLRRRAGRDGRRRAGRGRDRVAGRHHAGAAGARAWATASRRPRPASSRSPTSSS